MNRYPGGNAAAAAAARASNQYQFQRERASLVSAPVPTPDELERLTNRVAAHNFYSGRSGQDRATMKFLREHIKHVIYVVKENRKFDQVLGDGSNGDSSITQFGRALTPNQHRYASDFVTLDNFLDPGDGSMGGWSWSLQGRVTNTEAITLWSRTRASSWARRMKSAARGDRELRAGTGGRVRRAGAVAE